MTHEHVLPDRPAVLDRWVAAGPGVLRATEVSVSVADRLVNGVWVRSEPTVQVEGGSYGLAAARQLRQALDDAIRAAEDAGGAGDAADAGGAGQRG